MSNKNYGEIKLFRTVKEYLEERYGAIRTFYTLIPDTLAITFDVTDSLYNKLGIISVIDEFNNSDFNQGVHDNVLVKNHRLYLNHGSSLKFNGYNKVNTSWYVNESDLGTNGEGTLEYWAYFTEDNVDQFLGSFGRLEDPDDLEADIKEDPLYSRLYMGRYQTGVLRIGYGDDWRNIHDAEIPLNQWVHLAMTNDGTTTYGYVNGNFVGDNPSSFYWDNINEFTIGQCNGAYEESGGPVNRPIHGMIDEVRIWNVCRTEQEIVDNKDIKIDPNSNNLVRYWRLDEYGQDTITCSVNSNVKGDLVGDPKPIWEQGKVHFEEKSGSRIVGPIYIDNYSNNLNIIWDAFIPEGIIPELSEPIYDELKSTQDNFPDRKTGTHTFTPYHLDYDTEIIDESEFSIYIPPGTNSLKFSIKTLSYTYLYVSFNDEPNTSTENELTEKTIAELIAGDKYIWISGGDEYIDIIDDVAIDTSEWTQGKWINFRLYEEENEEQEKPAGYTSEYQVNTEHTYYLKTGEESENIFVSVQTTTTNTTSTPNESDWETQSSLSQISSPTTRNYLWIRYLLTNEENDEFPYFNWLVVYDNITEPYALPFINCNDETKVLNTDGQTVFNVPSGYLNPHNLRFHGNDNESWIDLGNSLYLPNNHPFTAEGSITFNSFSSRDMLLSRNDAVKSGSPYAWLLGLKDNGTRIAAYDGSSWREIEYQFILNKKYHLAFAYDGTDMYFYVDGELVGIYEGWTFSDSETGRNTQIGGYSSSSNDVNGIKSNIRFWDYARTQEQIQNNINEFIVNPEEGLMGNWHLAEGKDDVVYDYSGNDIHGTLQGTTEWINSDHTLTIIPLNENYVFAHETIDGFLGYVEENEFIELFVEVNSFRFTHQYVEAAVFPTEFPVRFTHQYIEKAAVIYTYLPNLPPFDWYPCFNSTSCWANWTIQEYEGATEGQVLQFTPPSTSNNRQGLFWLTKNAENAILQVKAKVDRVRSAHTEPGIPPPEPIPYSPIIAQRNQPSTLSWFNNILENVVVENNAIQLEPEETEGYMIWYPLDISTGYQDDLEYEGEAPPQIVGSSIIEWSSTEPEGTEIKVYVAIRLEGEDGTQIEEHEWIPAVNGESIPEIEEGDIFDNQYLFVRVEFVTDDPEVTPILHSLSATIYEPEKSGEYQPINGIQYFGIFSRGSGMNNSATTCYVLSCTITNDGNRRRQIELGKYTSGSYFRLDAKYFEWEIDEFYFLKIASNADWVQGKIWKASDPEPAGYQLSARDSLTWSSGTETLGSGFSGVYCHNASNTDGLPNYYFDSFYFTPTILKSRISDKLTVKVVSVRDTYESWQSQEHTLERWGYGTYYGERCGN